LFNSRVDNFHHEKKDMSKRKKKTRQVDEVAAVESRTVEAITVAWTVSVTTLFVCNLGILAAHFFLANNPDAAHFAMMKKLLITLGAMCGVISLILLVTVYRMRPVLPPSGLMVFGVCMALGPILAAVAMLVR
jgi:hypothetical protein